MYHRPGMGGRRKRDWSVCECVCVVPAGWPKGEASRGPGPSRLDGGQVPRALCNVHAMRGPIGRVCACVESSDAAASCTSRCAPRGKYASFFAGHASFPRGTSMEGHCMRVGLRQMMWMM